MSDELKEDLKVAEKQIGIIIKGLQQKFKLRGAEFDIENISKHYEYVSGSKITNPDYKIIITLDKESID